MDMQSKLLAIYFFTLVSSCSMQNSENSCDFSSEYNIDNKDIKYEFILEDEPGIDKVYIIDSLILTFQSIEYDWAFKVFNKSSLKFLGEFGDRSGPDRILTPQYSGQFFLEKDGIKIGFGDNNRPVWWLLNLTKSIESGTAIIERKIELPNGEGLFFNSYFHPSDKFVGNTTHTLNKDVARLKFLNIENDSSWVIPLTPDSNLARNLNRGEKNRYYGSNLVMSPNGQYFASGLILHNQIDFYNQEGNLINTFKEDGELKLSKDKSFEETLEERRVYYGCSFAADNFFLISHWKGFSYNEQNINDAQMEIRAFSYEGKPLFKIHSPYIFESLSLDLEVGNLYGYVDSEESVIKLNINNQLKF